jgi:putative ABC transport system permease protein
MVSWQRMTSEVVRTPIRTWPRRLSERPGLRPGFQSEKALGVAASRTQLSADPVRSKTGRVGFFQLISMGVTWFKLWRDLSHNKARTALVVISMAVGLFVLGVILGAYSMMLEGLDRDWQAWVPVHVSLWGWFVPDEAEQVALREEGVADVECMIDTAFHYRLVDGDAERSQEWREARLIARQDYEQQRFGVIRLLAGDWPSERAIAVESMTADYYGVYVGSVILVQAGNHERRLSVAGIVRDPDAGMPPRFGGRAYYYATPDTATWLTGDDYNRIDVRLDSPGDADVRVRVDELRARMDSSHMPVWGTWIRNPDEHWFRAAAETLLVILTTSGGVSLLLSVFLIVNTVNAIVAQQVWQIGVMKVVGATGARVVRTYLAIGLCYGVLALLLAVPLGAAGAYWLAAWALDQFELAIGPFYVVPGTVLVQVGVGLAVPLLASLPPVLGGARTMPHDAISTYGLGSDFGRGLLDRLMGLVRWLPRPMALSLRNTFRHRARVVLTLIALALGGALFVAVLSTQASCSQTLRLLLADSGADATVHFADAYRVERLLAATEQTPAVVRAEVWKQWNVRLQLDEGRERPLRLVGVPPDSHLLRPRIIAGRGLLPGDGNAIVLNSTAAFEEGIAVGDTVRFDIQDRETTWTVVGLVVNAQERSLVPFATLSRETESRNVGWEVAVMAEDHDAASQRALVDSLRAAYVAYRLDADDFSTTTEYEARVWSRFGVVLYLLLAISLLAAVVGSIGLTGTMSINVVERRREIGVMRATGASSSSVAAIFVAEGVVIGALSWLLAVPLSYPSARLFSNLVGESLLRVPFEFVYAVDGAGLWLFVVLLVSALASLWPALQATRVSVREALSYE